MSFKLLDTEHEELERLVYEIENSKLPLRRLAAELLLFRKLYRAVRDLHRLPPSVHAILNRIPRISDRQAWAMLSREDQIEAGLDAIEEEEKQ